ncbi:MAG: hypothetical protein C5S38_01805 [Candidatus Methanophagaceae archaeon]|nr:MAG: hypothetical protein C5S38_01805 [Methanophagales archaeon]KAF5432761.1 hypothetical protein C5S36_07935 [Methanophagales archaeon]
MSVTAIKSRLARLEESEQTHEHIRILCIDVDSDGDPAGDIIDRCVSATDEETFHKALDAAFRAILGDNQKSEDNHVTFFDITEEIARKCAEELRGAGVDVKC